MTVRIDLTGWQGAAADADTRSLLQVFTLADRLGFDGVWFNELHFQREGLPYPSPALLAAAIFAVTDRLRVGLSVAILPIHHPLLLAEELSQLDGQGYGRLDVGVGRGTAPRLAAVFPLSDAERTDRFRAALELLVAAWTGQPLPETAAFGAFPGVAVGPPPVQQPHPPLYVAGYTLPTIALAVACNLPLLLRLEPNDTVQREMLHHATAAQEYEALRRCSLARYVCIAPTQAAAEAQVDRLLSLLKRRRQSQVGSPSNGVPSGPTRSRAEFLATQAIAGTPDSCVDQIHALVEQTGMTQLRCVFNGNGVLNRAETLAALTLFGHEALPGCHEHQAATAPEER